MISETRAGATPLSNYLRDLANTPISHYSAIRIREAAIRLESLEREVTALRGELEGRWQPMETASKEHGHKMLAADSDGQIHVAWWDRLCKTWDNGYEPVEAIRWMPLPPLSKHGEGGGT